MYEKSVRGPFKPNRTVDADRHACQLPLNNFTTPMLNKRYIKQRILHTDAPYVVSRSHQRSKRSFARSYCVRNKLQAQTMALMYLTDTLPVLFALRLILGDVNNTFITRLLYCESASAKM